jgi:hypothetical protein
MIKNSPYSPDLKRVGMFGLSSNPSSHSSNLFADSFLINMMKNSTADCTGMMDQGKQLGHGDAEDLEFNQNDIDEYFKS